MLNPAGLHHSNQLEKPRNETDRLIYKIFPENIMTFRTE